MQEINWRFRPPESSSSSSTVIKATQGEIMRLLHPHIPQHNNVTPIRSCNNTHHIYTNYVHPSHPHSTSFLHTPGKCAYRENSQTIQKLPQTSHLLLGMRAICCDDHVPELLHCVHIRVLVLALDHAERRVRIHFVCQTQLDRAEHPTSHRLPQYVAEGSACCESTILQPQTHRFLFCEEQLSAWINRPP